MLVYHSYFSPETLNHLIPTVLGGITAEHGHDDGLERVVHGIGRTLGLEVLRCGRSWKLPTVGFFWVEGAYPEHEARSRNVPIHHGAEAIIGKFVPSAALSSV